MSNIFVTGGQVSLHALRMLKQVMVTMGRWGMILTLILTIYFTALTVNIYQLKVFYWVSLAEVACEIKNYKYNIEVTDRSGNRHVMEARNIINNAYLMNIHSYVIITMIKAIIYAAIVSLISLFLLLIFFFWKGNQVSKDEELRGNQLVSEDKLIQLINKSNKSEKEKAYKLAHIPYPAHATRLHTFIAGSTGSGKTVLISDLIDQIQKRGDRAIIYDKMGVYTERFYHPKRDILLNPFDRRSPNWSIFKEVKHSAHFDAIAMAFMPLEKGNYDPFWIKAARTIFTEVCSSLLKKGGVSNEELVNLLLKKNLVEAAQLVRGTAAQAILDPESPKTALSVMSVLSTYLKCFKFLQDEGEVFSIREWVQDDKREGSIFITSSGDLHSSLMPLISAWLEIAINNILSLNRSKERKIWIILDELPSLHTLPSLEQGLAETRQFGGCFVLSVQSISQLRDRYGMNGSQTISSLCNNKVFLRAGDPDSAKWYAENIGVTEIEEFREGLSFGAHEMRDGVSVNKNKISKQLVLPSELLGLGFGEGYFCMAGKFPIGKVNFKYKEFPNLNQARDFIEEKEEVIEEGDGSEEANTKVEIIEEIINNNEPENIPEEERSDQESEETNGYFSNFLKG